MKKHVRMHNFNYSYPTFYQFHKFIMLIFVVVIFFVFNILLILKTALKNQITSKCQIQVPFPTFLSTQFPSPTMISYQSFLETLHHNTVFAKNGN